MTPYPFTNSGRSHKRVEIFTTIRVGAPAAAASGIPVVRQGRYRVQNASCRKSQLHRFETESWNACYGPPAVSGGRAGILRLTLRDYTQRLGQSGADDRG